MNTLCQPGMVYLVGAGPGSASLLTLEATEILAQADSVVFDRLCGYHFLTHIRPGTRLHNVGKRDNQHLVPQDEICALLVSEAKAGHRVVRLKGGDPFVFGRGGEEAQYLLQHQIPFHVVPGISSCIAVPAAAGIPVTHRDHCTGFHVITGHLHAQRQEGAYDYAALTSLKGTLVFLMGVKNLPHIVEGLITHGMPPQTPAAVVSQGYTAKQQSVHAPLCDLPAATRAAGIQPPAITLVGSVTTLGPELCQGQIPLPLTGINILVTRTRQASGKLAGRLRCLGAHCLELPLIRTEPNLDPALWNSLRTTLPTAQWVVFTSENGVNAFFEGLRTHKIDQRLLAHLKFAVVGPATAQALLKAGYQADLQPTPHQGQALAQALLTQGAAQNTLILARAAQSEPQLSEILNQSGAKVLEYPIYHTHFETTIQELVPELVAEGEFDWIPFASSSAVTAFVQAMGSLADLPSHTRFACIGPTTAATAEKLGLPVHALAQEATLDGLIQAMLAQNLSP